MRNVLAAVAAVALLAGCAVDNQNDGNNATSGESQRQASLSEAIEAIKARNYDSAEAILARILADNPNDPYANLNMGVLKAITDDKDAARQFYQVAIANGENAPMGVTTTANGTASATSGSTTVADIARGNVSRL